MHSIVECTRCGRIIYPWHGRCTHCFIRGNDEELLKVSSYYKGKINKIIRPLLEEFWPEDDWIDLGKKFILNLFRNDDELIADVYAKTEEGTVITDRWLTYYREKA